MSDNTYNHPEWNKEHSLTAPSDRNPESRWRPEQGAPLLTEPEVEAAMQELNNTSFTDKFPRLDRTYADPPVPMQNIGLLSFTPATGATPNEKGVFGFAKLRGNFATSMEADQRAEFIIRNVDSYHQVYHAYVGRPFPITISTDYSADTNEIDTRREMTQAISSNIKKQTEEEQKTVKEMQEREAKLLAESRKARADDGIGAPPEEDPYDRYITLCVKKAQLSWTFLEHLKKLDEVRNIIVKTRDELARMDDRFPDFRDKYFEKYMEARRSSGLDNKVREGQDNFIQYMVEDATIPTIDTDEVLPKVPGSRSNDEDNDEDNDEEKEEKEE